MGMILLIVYNKDENMNPASVNVAPGYVRAPGYAPAPASFQPQGSGYNQQYMPIQPMQQQQHGSNVTVR